MIQKEKWIFAVDIGGTNTKYAIVDTKGEIYGRGHFSTKKFSTPEAFIEALYEKYLEIKKSFKKNNIVHIGVCAPNANYFTGTIEHAANLKWDRYVPLKEMIESRFGIPCVLSNDANAAALGEMK